MLNFSLKYFLIETYEIFEKDMFCVGFIVVE